MTFLFSCTNPASVLDLAHDGDWKSSHQLSLLLASGGLLRIRRVLAALPPADDAPCPAVLPTPPSGGALDETPAEENLDYATLWALDNESIERLEKHFEGKTQTAALFRTRLAGIDVTMKVMLNIQDTMYLREIEALLAMKGRAGAPRLFGYGIEYPMLMHECLRGQNLLNLVLDARTPIRTFVQALVGVVRRLRELHALNFVHNILATGHVAVALGADYEVEGVNLIEFTAACQSGLSLGLLIDRAAYPHFAPEVAAAGVSTPASDIFGVLISDINRQKANSRALPREALEAMQRAMQEEPLARPDYAVLEEVLDRALAH